MTSKLSDVILLKVELIKRLNSRVDKCPLCTPQETLFEEVLNDNLSTRFE